MTVHTHEKQRAALRFWTLLLAGTVLLALALWLLVVELLPQPSLATKYGFSPSSVPLDRFQHAYRLVATQYALWTLVLTGLALAFAWQTPTATTVRVLRTTQWLLCVLALVFVAMQVVAWTKSTHYAQELALSKSDVGAAFNDVFCETRALQVCVQDDELETLLSVIGGSRSQAPATTDTVKATTLAVWLRCRDLLVVNHGRLATEQLRLLSDCNVTAATDAWCGRHFLRQIAGDTDRGVDVLATTADAPFGANPAVFDTLVREWPMRYRHDALFLGAAVLCAVALSWTLARLRRDGSDGFELIEMKAASLPRTAPAMVA